MISGGLVQAYVAAEQCQYTPALLNVQIDVGAGSAEGDRGGKMYAHTPSPS